MLNNEEHGIYGRSHHLKGGKSMKRKNYAAIITTMAITPAIVMPYNANAEETGFKDIAPSSPYADAVNLLKEKGAITGFPDNTYRPQETITRQHVLVLLDRLIDLQPVRATKEFVDVPKNHPYYETIQKAYQAGLIDGYTDGSFNPNAPITRAQIAKVLTKAFSLQATETVKFTDVSGEMWSYPYIQALGSHHITTTTNGAFLPNEFLTRGQYALFLQRILTQQESAFPIGQWGGNLEIPQSHLSIQLQINEDGTGQFFVPSQGISNYPVSSITMNGQELQVEINLAGSIITIKGTVQDKKINATFTQNGMTFPLILTPYEKPSVTYEELLVPVKGGQLKVALEMPKTAVTGKIPVAVIIAGSGPTNKDGNSAILGDNNSLKMLAEGLAEQGIASIRFDKRGVGENTMLMEKEEDLLFTDYAQDVDHIIQTIEQDPRFSSVHLIGHSEGSLVGMVAAQSTKVASFTSIAGAGRPIDEVLIEQLSAQLPPDLLTTSKSIIEQLKKGQLVDDVPESLYSLFRPSVQPYFISWLKYDPAALLQQLNVQSLIVQGKNDLQVKVTDAEQLSAAKPEAETLYFDNMNHVLKDAPTDAEGNLATYSNPTLPLTKGLVEGISDFILER